jgi:hypothetical protein
LTERGEPANYRRKTRLRVRELRLIHGGVPFALPPARSSFAATDARTAHGPYFRTATDQVSSPGPHQALYSRPLFQSVGYVFTNQHYHNTIPVLSLSPSPLMMSRIALRPTSTPWAQGICAITQPLVEGGVDGDS